MKRLIATIVLSTGLVAAPAMAEHGGGNLLNRENLGGAIGAAIGGLAGNKIVDGKGQSAATAAGAVGGFLVGKNIAHNYRGGKHRADRHPGYRGQRGRYEPRGHRKQSVSPINRTFVARTTSNVRAGPSTRYSITNRLHRRERVHVIGKVQGRNWFLVRTDRRRGYVYAPLLRPARHDGYRAHGGWQDRGHQYDRRGRPASSGWHR
ncbi:MAG TPA: SH3 domain-containing protein [Arenicellales bacterium]|nr:SH3 domain-containing protein [Arenicellales bacterium]